jgi:hypothetical protein
MKKQKRKKNKFAAARPQHPFPRNSHLMNWSAVWAFLLLLALLAGMAQAAPAQEKKPGKLAFLIFGTVLDEKGFALPGAEIRVRRAGEKKVRGEAYSDRRGEFGVRVPLDFEYEVRVKLKGFEEQVQTADARAGNRKDLVFRMKPATKGKRQ